MSSLIAAIDIEQSKRYGENGHLEYDSFAGDLESRIVGLSFQTVRTKNMSVLADELKSMLNHIKHRMLKASPSEKEALLECLCMLYCMIGQTRDVIAGKGEYALAYMMIYEWYGVFPKLAEFALETFVLPPVDATGVRDTEFHPYGSWKDMKHFVAYCFSRGSKNHPLFHHIVRIMNAQLRLDAAYSVDSSTDTDKSVSGKMTLLAKWIPRQSSSVEPFLHLNRLLAYDYFSEYLGNPSGQSSGQSSDQSSDQSLGQSSGQPNTKLKQQLAKRKCIAEYRKLVSGLNRTLDTIQIKQCAQSWCEIDHNKTTSITLSKQKNALLNLTKDGKNQRSDKWDRILCAQKFREFIENRLAVGKEVKGGRVSMIDFSKRALDLVRQGIINHAIETELLNSQWRDNAAQTGALTDFVAMVDTSASMTWEGGDPFHVALALGIRVAEKSRLGKRVLTFSTSPTWCNLDKCKNFVEMVNVLSKSDAGGCTNFGAAVDLILDALVRHRIPPEEAAKITLVVFSDMQIDSADNKYDSMFDGIAKKYAAAGYTQPPHIIFWNLRSTGGSPCLTKQANTSMMSGFSPALLNLFCEKGAEALLTMTPASILKESLDNPRYTQLAQRIRADFC